MSRLPLLTSGDGQRVSGPGAQYPTPKPWRGLYCGLDSSLGK